ncbi:single-stranded DNA-binding protein, partial [Enterococcus faecium]|uniref:single-stranded DNA-binding protein n=1 Tax=Enterococcus faecium TaxID=1352 RepID=UPI0022EBEA7A
TMATLAKKGSLTGVVGRIQTRTYDNQQGQRVYVTEVVADNFQLLESKAATESRAHADQSSTSPSITTFEQRDTATPNNNGLNASQNPFGGQSIDISDDDLPF